MAKRTYRVGADQSVVKIDANVTTNGIAATNVSWVVDGSDFSSLFDSEIGSNGDLDSEPIGTGMQLRNTQLSVQTLINFSGIDEAHWPKDANRVFKLVAIQYSLNGGPSGRLFLQNYDVDDIKIFSNGKFVLIKKGFVFSDVN